jgi:nicotinamide mononucleotide (NMN) deamidase PncC
VTGADVGLGITGVAGPDDQEGVAPGTVFVGLHARPGRPRPANCGCPAIGNACASTGRFRPSTCCDGRSTPSA